MKTLGSTICLSAILLASGVHAAPNPWFGVWKLRLENSTQTPETLIYSDAGGGAMRMVSVEDKSEVVTNFDGEPASDLGETSSHSQTLAIKAVTATSYAWTFARDRKPRAQGVNTLSSDGKTFKEVSWAVEAPEKTRTSVYDRQ